MKKNTCILLMAVVVFSLASCGNKKTSGKDQIIIGSCVMDISNEIFVLYSNGYRAFEEAANNKVKINVVDGASKPEKQVEALENFIITGVDAIMLNALDLSAVEDVVDRAVKNGIKVGIYPARENVTVNFVFDEYLWGFDLGVAAGNWINEHLNGKAKIACFNQAELEQALGRYNGYIDGVKSVCDAANVTFLEPISTVEPVSAQAGMETILQAHPDVKVVLGSADAAAVGAYQAIIGANIDTSDMFLGGCDGISEALQYIKEGSVFRATCANAKSTEEMGFDLVKNLTKAVLGLNYESTYVAPTKIVDRTNIDEYLAAKPNFTLDSELEAALRE
jgi:ABC-type sugar transport system substrate-binding protein